MENAQIIVQALAGNSLGTQSFLEARDVKYERGKSLSSHVVQRLFKRKNN